MICSMHSLEAEPLLTVDRATESNTTSQAGSPAGKAKTSQDFNFRNERAVILTFTMYFIYYFICIYLNVPIIRLVEYAVCERHFRADSNPVKAPVTLKDMDELLCKIKPVQAEVAIILGVRFSLEALAGFLTALFYSFIADRYGRRLVLALGCIGDLFAIVWIVLICQYNVYFNTRVVWVSALFILIGGGQRVFISMLLTMVADVTQSAERSKVLYILHAMGFLSGLFAPTLAALSMTNSQWLPFGIGLALYLLQILLISTAPETARGTSSQSGLHDYVEPSETDQERRSSPPTPFQTEASTSPSQRCAVFANFSTKDLKTLKKNIGSLLAMPNILICLLLFFVKNAAFQSESLVYQYASEKFDLKLQSTPWFKADLCVGAFLATAFILPWMTVSLRRRGAQLRHIELGVVRTSFTLMSIMFFVVWATPDWLLLGIALFGCGLAEGIESALQGFITSSIEASQFAQMFAIIGLMDTSAKLISGPTMAALYNIGRDQHGKPNGVCFLVSSSIFLLSALITSSLRSGP